MSVFAVIDETGFQAGLDAGDHALIDIALSGFAARRLDVDVDQLLAFDDGDAQLFRVRRVEQHAFHPIPFSRASGVVRGASGSTLHRRVSALGVTGQNASGSGGARSSACRGGHSAGRRSVRASLGMVRWEGAASSDSALQMGLPASVRFADSCVVSARRTIRRRDCIRVVAASRGPGCRRSQGTITMVGCDERRSPASQHPRVYSE